jgi:hypothetical protein
LRVIGIRAHGGLVHRPLTETDLDEAASDSKPAA